MDEQVLNDTTAIAAGSALGAFLATLGIFAIVIGIAWYILQVIAYWKIFNKAGKPGWHSIIPILNDWDKVDLSWSRTIAWVWLAMTIVSAILYKPYTNAQNEGVTNFVTILYMIVAVVLVVVSIVSEYKLAKAFGKGFGFFLGLLFLNPIFKMILGFGDAQYQGRQG